MTTKLQNVCRVWYAWSTILNISICIYDTRQYYRNAYLREIWNCFFHVQTIFSQSLYLVLIVCSILPLLGKNVSGRQNFPKSSPLASFQMTDTGSLEPLVQFFFLLTCPFGVLLPLFGLHRTTLNFLRT